MAKSGYVVINIIIILTPEVRIGPIFQLVN